MFETSAFLSAILFSAVIAMMLRYGVRRST